MDFEENIKSSFAKVKEDIESIKNELAMALKRIANLESLIAEASLKRISKNKKLNKKKY